MSAHFDGFEEPESCQSCDDRSERDLNRLVGLAQAISEYLHGIPTERFADPHATPRLIEDRFFRISRYLEEQLIPKES